MQYKIGEGASIKPVITNKENTFKEKMIWQMNYNLRRRYCLLNCRRLVWITISIVQKYRCRCTGPWRTLLLLNDISQFSILITTCLVVAARCSWQFSQTPWCQFQRVQALQWILNSHVPLLRLSQMLRLLGVFNGPLLSNLKNIVSHMLLIMRFQQVEDVFSTPRKNLRVCLNVLGLEQTTWERNYLSWGLLHVTCHIFLSDSFRSY